MLKRLEYHVNMAHVLVALCLDVAFYSILAWYISRLTGRVV